MKLKKSLKRRFFDIVKIMKRFFPMVGAIFVGIGIVFLVSVITSDFKVGLSSDALEQGDSLFIKVTGGKEPKGTLAGVELSFLKADGAWISVYGIDVRKTPGNYRLTIKTSSDNFDKDITVNKEDFPITEFVVTKELADRGYSPSGIEEDIVGKENRELSEILNISNPTAYFSKPFVYPLDKIDIVGYFGNIRNSGNTWLWHLGTDLKADTGAPVYAINDGKVVFRKNLSNYGKTMAIDHGLGIYSLYLHLNEFKVSLGERVKKGEVIAAVGNIGYSIVPHLHFSVKINDGTSLASIDPLRFIESANKMME